MSSNQSPDAKNNFLTVDVDKIEEFKIEANLQSKACACGGRSGVKIVNGKAVKCECRTMGFAPEMVKVYNEDAVYDVHVPEMYLGKKYDANLLKAAESIDASIKSTPLFHKYIKDTEELHNMFVGNMKIPNSIMLMAPQGCGKNHFVYSAIQYLIRFGKKTSNFIDGLDVASMLADKQNKKLNDVILLESDVLFVKVPTGLTFDQNWSQACKFVLDKRARADLPTIFTCRFPKNYLYKIELNMNRVFVDSDVYGEVAVGDYSKVKIIECAFPDYSEQAHKYTSPAEAPAPYSNRFAGRAKGSDALKTRGSL